MSHITLLHRLEKIPIIQYTQDELQTWNTVFLRLTSMYKQHACHEVNKVFSQLESNCAYSENAIPQLQHVSEYLQGTTGFTLRPVAGLVSAREFLNGLAFRVFHCTQYIRHHSNPYYTPEPDVVHELMGHVPLLSIPLVADLNQHIGLASLGASEEELKQLTAVYWYTIEYGICLENGRGKAIGAALLSSFGEMEHAFQSKKAEMRDLNLADACVQQYPIDDLQSLYYVASDFRQLIEQVQMFVFPMIRCKLNQQTGAIQQVKE